MMKGPANDAHYHSVLSTSRLSDCPGLISITVLIIILIMIIKMMMKMIMALLRSMILTHFDFCLAISKLDYKVDIIKMNVIQPNLSLIALLKSFKIIPT